MRRLLPCLGFLPLVLILAVCAFAQEEAQPGWDPITVCGGGPDIYAGAAFTAIGAPLMGLLIGVCGLGRGRLHRMRAVPRIYHL